MGNKPKQTTVYPGGGTLDEVLSDIASNESTPTAAAAAVEGKADAPVYVPPVGGAVPTLHGGNGPEDLAGPGLGPASAVPALPPAEGAQQSCATLMMLTSLLDGGAGEWEPDSADEQQQMVRAFERVYAIRGVPNIPPEVGLIVLMGAYAKKRIHK